MTLPPITAEEYWKLFGFTPVPKTALPHSLVEFVDNYLAELNLRYHPWKALEVTFLDSLTKLHLLMISKYEYISVNSIFAKLWEIDELMTRDLLRWGLAHEFGHHVFELKRVEPSEYPTMPPIPPIWKLPEPLYAKAVESYANLVALRLTGIPASVMRIKKRFLLMRLGLKPPGG